MKAKRKQTACAGPAAKPAVEGCREMQWLKPLLVARGSWSHNPLHFPPEIDSQASKKTSGTTDMTGTRRKKRKGVSMLSPSLYFSCYYLACAQCSKEWLGWGSVPGARCPSDQGQEPARVLAGQDRTAPALPLSWLPRKGVLLEPRSSEKGCQKATNPKCWDGQ